MSSARFHCLWSFSFEIKGYSNVPFGCEVEPSENQRLGLAGSVWAVLSVAYKLLPQIPPPTAWQHLLWSLCHVCAPPQRTSQTHTHRLTLLANRPHIANVTLVIGEQGCIFGRWKCSFGTRWIYYSLWFPWAFLGCGWLLTSRFDCVSRLYVKGAFLPNRTMFLPCYRPLLNPVESMWSSDVPLVLSVKRMEMQKPFSARTDRVAA